MWIYPLMHVNLPPYKAGHSDILAVSVLLCVILIVGVKILTLRLKVCHLCRNVFALLMSHRTAASISFFSFCTYLQSRNHQKK